MKVTVNSQPPPITGGFRPNKLLSLNHDHLAGNRSVYERYNVLNAYTIRMPCAGIMCKEKWEPGGMVMTGISLSPTPGRDGSTPRLHLRCSVLSRCSCLLLLPRSDSLGLPNCSPFRISYPRKDQTRNGYSNNGLRTRCIQRRKIQFHLVVIKVVLDRGQWSRRGLHTRR